MGYLLGQRKKGLGGMNLSPWTDVQNQDPVSPYMPNTTPDETSGMSNDFTLASLIDQQSIKPEPDILPMSGGNPSPALLDLPRGLEPDPITGDATGFNLGTTPTTSMAPQPKTGLYDNWKTQVFNGMPLDKFVQLTGMAAHALDPQGFGGILGKNVAQMGAHAEQGRLGYEERQATFQLAANDKRFGRLVEIASKSKSPALQEKVLGTMVEDWNKNNPDNKMPPLKWDDSTADFLKTVTDIRKTSEELKYGPEVTNQLIRDEMLQRGLVTGSEWGKESLGDQAGKNADEFTVFRKEKLGKMNPTTNLPWTEAETITDFNKIKAVGTQGTPHTTTETSPNGKQERTVLWDATKNGYAPMQGAAGEWHAAKSQVINITNAQKEAEGFKTWTPEAQKQAFMYNLITKEPPVSTKGMGAGDRQAYAKTYSQWQVDSGFKPGDVALIQSDYRAGDMSLKNMSKQEAPMSAFVLNINKQITKVEELYKNDDRTGLRLLDLPLRELKVRGLGSGAEANKAAYLLEISNEIGKLSSGASGSVQQLSDSAKEDWKKVHDVNLSLKEIMIVVNGTRDQANMRMSSWREAKQEVRKALGDLGVPGGQTENAPGSNLPAFDVKVPKGTKGFKWEGGKLIPY